MRPVFDFDDTATDLEIDGLHIEYIADNDIASDNLEEIYRLMPMTTMAAQTLADHFIARYPVQRHDFAIQIRTDDTAAIITFRPKESINGAVDSTVFESIGEYISYLSNISHIYTLNSVYIDKDMGLIGTDTNHDGFLDLIAAVARHEDLTVGPEIDHGLKAVMGPYRMADMEAAWAVEKTKMGKQAFDHTSIFSAASELPQDPTPEENASDMEVHAERFITEIIYKFFPREEIFYAFYPMGEDFRHVLIPNHKAGTGTHSLTTFFEKIKSLDVPPSIVLNEDDFVIRAKDALEFGSFIDQITALLSSEMEQNQTPVQMGEECTPFWAHAEPETSIHACALLMQGMTEHLCNIQEGVCWHVNESLGAVTLHAEIEKDAPNDVLQERMERLSRLLCGIIEKAGDWNDFAIDIERLEISFMDMRTFCQVIDLYFDENRISAGRDTFQKVEIGEVGEDELNMAILALDNDYTLVSCLSKQYVSKMHLARDVIRLMRQKEAGFYAGPVSTDDIMKHYMREHTPDRQTRLSHPAHPSGPLMH